ncbi:metallophosphoesterase, partial [Bacillus subtilis]
LVKMGTLVRTKMMKRLHYQHEKAINSSEGMGQTGINIRGGSRPSVTFHQI